MPSRTKTTLLAWALLSASLTTVHAQELSAGRAGAQSAGDAATNAAASELEEVIVTATKQKRSLQEIPVSVNVVTQKQFTEAGYKNPSDLQFLSPSIQVASAGGIGFAIRGVGTQSNNLSNEQAVGTVVDGVTYGFNNDIGLDMTGVEQIEILRGPQSTTFGKSSTAGVINITTARPSFDRLTADAQLSYGTHRDVNSYAQVNLPISSNLAAYFSAAFKRRDGILYNPVLRKRAGDVGQGAVRAKLLWEPNSDLSIYFNSDWRSIRSNPNFLATWKSVGPLKGSGILDFGIVPGPRNTEIGDSTSSSRLVQTGGASVQIDQKIRGITLTSITALRYMYTNLHSTRNDTPIIYLNDDERVNVSQYSQEFRIASPTEGRLQYLAGLYYYERATRDNLLTNGPYAGLAEATFGPGALVSNAGGRQYSRNNVKNYAAYVNGIFEITDQLRLNGGARLSYDRARAGVNVVPVPGIFLLPGSRFLQAQSRSAHDSNLSYRIGPQYFITPDMQLYATAARGYKGAVVAVINAVGTQYAAPEKVQSYELGFKSTLFDRRMTFNIDVFHEHYTDFQTSVLNTNLTPAAFVLGNAGGMTAKGVEVTIAARPTANLTFNTAFTYQDSSYTDFEAPCYVFQPITTDPTGVGGCYTIPGTRTSFTQAAGSPLQNASKWNVTASIKYSRPLANEMTFEASVTNVYRTAFATTGYNPHTFINGYNVTGLNVGLVGPEGKWRAAFFVRNLFDRYYVSALQQATFDTGGYTQVVDPEARRTIGVQFNYHYF